ncbi:RecX family transcriptional regulator [Candidatus Saccharibacteria bacterium]|nr:RecX family transcriptional regulator [Candidatus Saccharibacteria bacterium]
MPTVTDITQQKKRTQLYNIFVDGAFFCSLSDLQLSLSGIGIGDEVEPDKLAELKHSSLYSKTYDRALYYISFRPRSTHEVRKYLQEKIEDSDQIEPVVQKLSEQQLLDDQQFARNWIENRNLLKPRSKRQLQQELRQKGVGSEIIEAVLAEQNHDQELQNIQKLIAKKRKASRKTDDMTLISHMSARGFRYADIKAVLGAESAG